MVENSMFPFKTYKSIMFLIIIFFICGCTDSGIIEGGTFIGKDNNVVKAFYLHDYVTRSKVEKHAISLANDLGYPSAFFYFSHNSSVPTQNLRISKSFKDASYLMTQYSHNLKYVLSKNDYEKVKFVDCMIYPENEICNGVGP